MNKVYKVNIEGQVLEGREPRDLLKRAVAAKRRIDANRQCKRCKNPILESFLAKYQLCLNCVDKAISWYADALAVRMKTQNRTEGEGAPGSGLFGYDVSSRNQPQQSRNSYGAVRNLV